MVMILCLRLLIISQTFTVFGNFVHLSRLSQGLGIGIFKVLVFTYKALHGIGPSYLQNWLCPITSTHPSHSGKEDMLQTCQSNHFNWQGLGTAITPALCHYPCIVEHPDVRGEESTQSFGLP